MTTLTIKDVPEHLAECLRQRAACNHRSLQGELMSIIEQAVEQPQAASLAPARHRMAALAPGLGAPLGGTRARRGWKSIEQVHAELRGKYPRPPDSGPSSIELIRQDRDAR